MICRQEMFDRPARGQCGSMKILLVPKASNSFNTRCFMPVMSAMTADTAATPMRMPSVVRIPRILFAQICERASTMLW